MRCSRQNSVERLLLDRRAFRVLKGCRGQSDLKATRVSKDLRVRQDLLARLARKDLLVPRDRRGMLGHREIMVCLAMTGFRVLRATPDRRDCRVLSVQEVRDLPGFREIREARETLASKVCKGLKAMMGCRGIRVQLGCRET